MHILCTGRVTTGGTVFARDMDTRSCRLPFIKKAKTSIKYRADCQKLKGRLGWLLRIKTWAHLKYFGGPSYKE